jgi:hypothetical protein
VGIFPVAELDGLEFFIESLRQGRRLAIVDLNLFVAVAEFTHRGDDRRRAGAETLLRAFRIRRRRSTSSMVMRRSLTGNPSRGPAAGPNPW